MIYSYLLFFAFLVFLHQAVSILRKNIHSKIHISFANLAVCFAIWALGYLFVANAKNSYQVAFWMKFAAVGFLLAPVEGFKMTLFLTSMENTPQNLTAKRYLLIYIPAFLVLILFLAFAQVPTDSLNWFHQYSLNFTTPLGKFSLPFLLAYFSVFLLLSFYHLSRFYFKTRSKNNRQQLILFFATSMLGNILISIFDFVLPLMGNHLFPPLGPLYFLIFMSTIWYSINRKGYLKMTPYMAIDDIISNIDDYLILTNNEHTITTVNASLSALMENRQEEILGKNLKEVLDVSDEELLRVQNNNKLILDEILLRLGQDQKLIVRASLSPIQNHKEFIGTVIVAQNIESTRKLLEMQEMRRIVEMKSRFISQTSHEFRTPMATILLSGETLERYYDRLSDEKKQSYFEKIKESIHRMTGLLENIQKIEKAVSGKIAFNPDNVAITELLEKILKKYRERFTKGYHFLLEIDTPKMMYYLDEDLVITMLDNLLMNSVKFMTGGGQIKLSVTSKDGQSLSMTVSDTGPGIPSKDIEEIFEPFYRGKNATLAEGNGLGLSIVKECVALHKGRVEVYSEPGIGTEVSICIPA